MLFASNWLNSWLHDWLSCELSTGPRGCIAHYKVIEKATLQCSKLSQARKPGEKKRRTALPAVRRRYSSVKPREDSDGCCKHRKADTMSGPGLWGPRKSYHSVYSFRKQKNDCTARWTVLGQLESRLWGHLLPMA